MELFGQITEEKYDLTFNINLRGLLFTVQKALPLMPDGGVVLLKGRNIRVNVVSPGPTDTPIFNKARLPEEMIGKIKATLVETIPAGRLGYPEEVAKPRRFWCRTTADLSWA